jgi:hypothetical protein
MSEITGLRLIAYPERKMICTTTLLGVGVAGRC